jgi:uncharacterized membrane protein required for colicin V production
MSLWILAIGLLVVFAAIGFAKGAIRMAVSFVGLLIGLAVAIPFGRALRPLMGTVGVENPGWVAVVPPIIAFVLVYLIAMGLSFFIHHKIYLRYKYKHDDVDRIRWENMNRHVGAGLGLVTGAVLLLAISGLIYAAGYLTVQLSAEGNNPAWVNFINGARKDMADSGFDKAAARFQPAPKIYYEAADVLGMIYHNPLLQNRLANYPYFLSLGEKPEFQEMANDKEFNDLIFGKAPVTAIIDHQRTQWMLGNTELLEYLKGTDVQDLKEYLRTGKSPKYEVDEIIGVWQLDKDAVVTHLRKSNPDIKARELRTLKAAFAAMPSVALLALPDKKVIVKGANDAPPPAEESAEAAPLDPIAARYGAQYARQMQGQQPVAPRPAEPAPPQVLPKFAADGSWEEEAGRYMVTLQDASGKELKAAAQIKGDEMLLNIAGTSLVFAKE